MKPTSTYQDDDYSLPAKLPVWPDATRGCPNVILRSALFGAVMKGKRGNFTAGVEITAYGKMSNIFYKGEALDQTDLDLWLEILHLTRTSDLGHKITFSARSMLKSLNLTITGGSVARLKENLIRLMSGVVTIETKNDIFSSHLLHGFHIDKVSELIVVSVDKDLANLFYDHQSWTQIELKNRRLLKLRLAQFLHGFYLTHTTPHNLKIATIQSLYGSQTNSYAFKHQLIDALNELKTVLGWTTEINNNLVTVKHPAMQYEEPIVLTSPPMSEQSPTKTRKYKSGREEAIALARLQRAKVAL